MISNIHSFLWSKYTNLITVTHLDTMDSWNGLIKISYFDLEPYIILPETIRGHKVPSRFKK